MTDERDALHIGFTNEPDDQIWFLDAQTTMHMLADLSQLIGQASQDSNITQLIVRLGATGYEVWLKVKEQE